jgi:lipoprotein-anchoring transpeptidase ErfK/SrfK
VLLALLLVVGAGFGVLAQTDQAAADRVPRGVVIGGVPVGHLTADEAIARLEQQIAAPARRSVSVRVEGRTYRLSAKRAGMTIDLRSVVQRAVDSGREGNFVARGWRELTKSEVNERETVKIAVDRKAIDKFVAGIAGKVARPAVDAQLTLTVDSVSVSESKTGRRLAGRASLVKRIERAFTRAGASRRLTAHTATVQPKQTAEAVWAAHPTVVTVSHDARRVTVFDHGRPAVRYHVAVGDPKYPTPYGQFSVQTMQKNPPWNVPQSEWAGDLAGQTIPGSDPRNPLVARWIGFNGSVGFHGTKDLASLGRAASHGCVRMDPKDVKDLYTRVQVGTPVLVGD